MTASVRRWSRLLSAVLGLAPLAALALQEAAPSNAAAPPGARRRDPRAVAAAIDRAVEARLRKESVAAAPRADDAEFLRRAHLDLVGRIPTAGRTAAFLDSRDPDRRAKLIDELLARPEHGQHFARHWARLIAAEEPPQRPILEKWLAGQFNANRGWDAVVTDLLTATGKGPPTGFVLSNVENRVPQPGKLAGSAARLFLGVQLQCAECHKHPFADWKQDDFWGLAAFFARTRVQAKGTPVGVAEGPTTPVKGKVKGKAKVEGAAIVLPATAGKGAGQVVRARFLGAPTPDLGNDGPYRPALAAWVTSGRNPYFARAAVNRLWGHLFGRGLVNPVDDLREENPPTHPAVLDLLAAEFIASGYDAKHLIRCVCATRAYQRTSRVAPGGGGNEEELYARMAVKVMSPDALYDSLCLAMGVKELKVADAASYGSGRGGKRGAARESPRDRFVKAFNTQDPETTPVEFTHGIPQALSLLNEAQLNAGSPAVDALVNKGETPESVIGSLFLATLNRRPTEAERRTFAAHVARHGPAKGYAGTLWVLLNSPEFALIP